MSKHFRITTLFPSSSNYKGQYNLRKRGLFIPVRQAKSENTSELSEIEDYEIDTSNDEEVKDLTTENQKNLHYAMKALRRRINTEGVIDDVRKKEYFISKGQKRRAKLKEAKMKERRRLNAERREWDPDALLNIPRKKRKRVRKD